MSKLKLGVFEEYINQFDVICLSETKLDNIDEKLTGFTAFHKEKTKFKHGGVHGLWLVTDKLASRCNVLKSKSDCAIWLQLRVPDSNCKLIIGSVYVPHEGSIHFDQGLFEDLCSDIVEFKAQHDEPILLMGDFNARTGSVDDFILYDNNAAEICGIDVHDYELNDECINTGGVEERHNLDTFVNNNGKNLIELCKCLDVKILNGRFGADKGIGAYTCTSTRGASTIDYAIASPSLSPLIKNVYVDNFDSCLSDVHSAICLSLVYRNLNCTDPKYTDVNIVHGSKHCHEKFVKWDPSMKCVYESSFGNDLLNELDHVVENLTADNVNQVVIDDTCSRLGNTFLDLASNAGMVKNIRSRTNCTSVKQTKVWFNRECHVKRVAYYKSKRILKHSPTTEHQCNFTKVCKDYKQCVKKSSRQYFRSLHSNLRNLQSTKPKEFWKLLNAGCNNNKSTSDKLDLDKFYEHFKKLSQAADNPEQSNVADSFDPRSISHSIN